MKNKVFIFHFILLLLLPFALFAQSNERTSFELRIGNYRILQYRAYVREEPSRSSNVIATLKLGDRVEVIENSRREEYINGLWGYWYKIQHENIIGYTFGGNIAPYSLVTDINKNGTNDYFFWRPSNNVWYLDSRKDLIIYINNRRINTDVLRNREYLHLSTSDYIFSEVIFEAHDGFVLIGLSNYGRHDYRYLTIYKIDGEGNIEYYGDGELW